MQNICFLLSGRQVTLIDFEWAGVGGETCFPGTIITLTSTHARGK